MAETERLDTEAMPLTERFTPTFDTGVHHRIEPEAVEPPPPARSRRWRRGASSTAEAEPESESADTADEPLTDDIPVPGPVHAVRWWQFVLTVLGVWVSGGAAGAGLFYWWSHDASRHKTGVVFVVLVYAVVTAVAGLVLAMVPGKPLVAALAVAMMSAVFAAVVGAAPVYGKFYCDHSHHRCVVGVLPY